MDQLVLYMAMATGRSSVLCSGRTSISSQHLETATALTTQITGVPFSLSPCEGVGGAPCVRVECEGLSWLNEPKWSGHVLGIFVQHGVLLELTCDKSWEKDCLVETLTADGFIQNERGELCRHVTLLPMRSLNGDARRRCETMHKEIATLHVPPLNFHPTPGTEKREIGSTIFFALRNQHQWRNLAEQIALLIGADAPPRERLFHMSVWNSQNGDPFRSIGDVIRNDFPFDVERQ